MSLFQRKPKETRTIDDILTPKEVDEEVVESAEEVEGDDVLTESEKEAETTVDETPKAKKKDIQIESPEEVSFNALTCFGWSETKTPKWLIKCAHFWYGFMSFLWFLLGAITFAPVIFIQKKINILFKDKTRSLLTAIVIYALMLAFIIFVIL